MTSGNPDQFKNTVLGHSHLLRQISLCTVGTSSCEISIVTARVTGLWRTDHSIRGTLKFPYFGTLLAHGLSKWGYMSDINKATRQNQQEKKKQTCLLVLQLSCTAVNYNYKIKEQLNLILEQSSYHTYHPAPHHHLACMQEADQKTQTDLGIKCKGEELAGSHQWMESHLREHLFFGILCVFRIRQCTCMCQNALLMLFQTGCTLPEILSFMQDHHLT